MRHGWKIRIEERRYFEEKKEQREQISIMRRMAIAQLNANINEQIEEMKKNHEIN